MKTTSALTGLILILILSASCTRQQQPERPPAQNIATRQPTPTPTPTLPPTATTEPIATAAPTPQSPNLALSGTARASAGLDSIHMAIDGDPETVWSSTRHPAQWIAITLDDLYLVERIDLVVAQAPAGPTTHLVWTDNGSLVRTLFTRLSDIHTENGQTLTIEVDPPQPIREILIQTLDSPSWVAWGEVRAYGVPLTSQTEKDKPHQFRLEEISVGFVQPVQVTHAGDGSGRIFVVEQHGRINVLRGGKAIDALFLDISNQVSCCEERGLFNVAFPPSFSASQRFYVSYTNLEGDTIISRFSTTDDPDIADPTSEEILLSVGQPHHAHNGGRLVFGPEDGYLYVGIGDGGSEGYPVSIGQDTERLLGKILRIDVESGDFPYGIPASNPFVDVDGYRAEIWALGFRNPWGFAFDRHTGELYIPDTGHNSREELNYVPPSSFGGENYGWPTVEGTRCMEVPDLPYPCTEARTFTSPVAEFDHTRGCAIVGGAVYRGNQIPELEGRFIFADFCRGDVWSLHMPNSDEATRSNRWAQGPWQSELILNASVPVSSIGEDELGNLYVTGYANGVVYLLSSERTE